MAARIQQAVREPPQYAPPHSSLCRLRSASRRRADRNVAVGSHSQYVPTLTAAAAWHLNATVSKAARELGITEF